ncbi:ATP-dependent helicase/nuclease subunit A [Candidatus Kinetoplastibacterium sorsogonicusi]|uniref:DNA 3'-5' helicase n=1 Tax=Candidatus Kinetoplastidibacterium kentomonadis TaxID=1576550 RepID=A0A3Q8ETY8_9PROT|nr:UvrD-helicase domain-containing protein [Candidatus Kinetoplastibacterium sorsogonicusi]AWD32273.1 ATP-dependent helicase/nuclease subunit A [Candidatus Kinetoplastibacterium sorsogonicusi]
MLKTYNLDQILDIDNRNHSLDVYKSFLIQAPAGSGKTELLVNRILSLLTIVNTPEEILAITFTKKAASEMHERIIFKLNQAASQYDSSNLAFKVLQRSKILNWDLLNNTSKLSIKTFDAFCVDILSKLQIYFESNFHIKITNYPDKYYVQVANSILNMIDQKASIRKLLLHIDLNLSLFKHHIIYMLKTRDQWISLIKNGYKKNLLKSSFIKSIELDLCFIKHNICDMDIKVKEAITSAANYLKNNVNNPLENFINWNGEFKTTINDLPFWKSFAFLILTEANKIRSASGVNKKLGFPSDSLHKSIFVEWLKKIDKNSPWIFRLILIRDILENNFHFNKTDYLDYQFEVLKIAIQKLKFYFQKYGEIDFIEIEELTYSYLKNLFNKKNSNNNIFIKKYLNISHILIDEFQDTSHNQLNLLETLTLEWKVNDKKTLFLVGDPNQSIYKFRNADVSIFSYVKNNGINKIKLIHLKLNLNFRSNKFLIEWINNCFKKLMPNNDSTLGQFLYEKSISYKEYGDNNHVKFLPNIIKNNNTLENTQSENIVINLIRKIIKSKQRNNSTVLLVRSRNHVLNLIKRFDKENIPYQAIDIIPLNSKAVISDLLQIIKAILHPSDRLAWLSLLRSPFCGLSLNTLHKLFGIYDDLSIPYIMKFIVLKGDWFFIQNDNNLLKMCICDINKIEIETYCQCQSQGILLDEYLRIKHIANAMIKNEFSYNSFTYELMKIWNQLGGQYAYFNDTTQDVQNFFQIIDETTTDNNIDIDLIEEQIKNSYSSIIKKNNNEFYIEIMTIHKSKGLEFDNVILYDIHKTSINDREPLFRFDKNYYDNLTLFSSIKSIDDKYQNPIFLYLKKRDEIKYQYELNRLVYVACTRSKNSIYFIGNIYYDKNNKIKKPNKKSFLYILWESLEHYQYFLDDNNYYKIDDKYEDNSYISRFSIESIKYLMQKNEDIFFKNNNIFMNENLFNIEIDSITHKWLHIIEQNPEMWNILKIESLYQNIQKDLIRSNIFSANDLDNNTCLITKIMSNTINNKYWKQLLTNFKFLNNISFLHHTGKLIKIDILLYKENNELLIINYHITHFIEKLDLKSLQKEIDKKNKSEFFDYYKVVKELYKQYSVKFAIFIPTFNIWIKL